jgi:hypothetical protein
MQPVQVANQCPQEVALDLSANVQWTRPRASVRPQSLSGLPMERASIIPDLSMVQIRQAVSEYLRILPLAVRLCMS